MPSDVPAPRGLYLADDHRLGYVRHSVNTMPVSISRHLTASCRIEGDVTAQSEVGESAPRKPRHPNSLANLKPAWQKGQSGNPLGAPLQGPIVTPAMRHYARMTIPELKILWENMDKLTGAEAIALTMVIDSLKTGSFTTGAKSRDAVLDRLDGAVKAGDITVNVDNRRIVVYGNGEKE